MIIPNAVFADTLPAKVPDLTERRRRAICAAGRLEDVKGFDILLAAFSLFHKEFPEHTLHIYGDGQLKNVLQEIIRVNGLQNHAFLEGYVKDVPAVLCRHTMFVFSSRHEGMPNALIEALACGLPCVATNCDYGPSELIDDGENGLLVPVDDIAGIAGAMGKIASDEIVAVKLAQNALQIRETHSVEKISALFYHYITGIANNGNYASAAAHSERDEANHFVKAENIGMFRKKQGNEGGERE